MTCLCKLKSLQLQEVTDANLRSTDVIHFDSCDEQFQCQNELAENDLEEEEEASFSHLRSHI